jgi:hypothetical protein
VGLGVQGEAYIGVTEELLDELGIYALPEQECGTSVAQVVETERLRQRGPLDAAVSILRRTDR